MENTTTPSTHNIEVCYTSSKDTVDKEADVLTLDTVKILMKDVKIHTAGNGDSANYAISPFVIYLDLRKNLRSLGTALVANTVFTQIKFEVHKLEPNEPVPDPEFKDSFGYYSVIAKGYFNGARFVYKSTKSAKQILNFPRPISVNSTYRANITLFVKPHIWFIKDSVYMDPNNPANSNDIDNNIKNNISDNFRAFQDDNKDGIPDN